MKFHRTRFFDGLRPFVRRVTGSPLTQGQVDGWNYKLAMIETEPVLEELDQIAYCLATAFHETAFTMQPIKERGSTRYFISRYWENKRIARELGNKSAEDAVNFAGKGDVQLTGRRNYTKATDTILKQFPGLAASVSLETGRPFDLVSHPELALHPAVSYCVLFVGMRDGWFTGKKLAAYDKGRGLDFEMVAGARRTVNGTDRQYKIVEYAVQIHSILRAALVTESETVQAGPTAEAEVKQSPDHLPVTYDDGTEAQPLPPANPSDDTGRSESVFDSIEGVTSQLDRPIEVAANNARRADSVKSLATTVGYWITSLGTLVASFFQTMTPMRAAITVAVLALLALIAYKYLNRQEELGKLREQK